MNEAKPDYLEEKLIETADAFTYPPTPDIAGSVRARLLPPRPETRVNRRRLAVAVAVLVLSLLVVTAVPATRAALFRILHIGAVQINLLEEPLPAAGDALSLFSIPDLGRQTSIEEAAQVISLPEPVFPPELGRADAIYIQDFLDQIPVVSFFWQAAPERPQLLITLIAVPQMGMKWAAGEQFTPVDVSGQPGAWIEGPHLFDLGAARYDPAARAATNVLLWSRNDITYRLEGDLSQDEALRIAESWN
jgi:hypothetical protein